MKTQITTLTCLILLLLSACSPKVTNPVLNSQPGQAIIQYENGQYSASMSIRAAFEQLKSNEKLYLSPGRVELTQPLKIKDLNNIQIIGSNTSLVAKIDMPVLSFNNTNTVSLSGLLVVHEIGEWCAQNCVEFYDSSDLNIQDCRFDGSGYFGLALTEVNKATIENNQLFNCEYGLAAWNCKNLLVKNNSFSKNRKEDIMVNDKAQFSNNINSENTFE